MIKIKHFEFWNTHLFHLPIYLYWLYLSIKARSLFFFSAANPGIETGGLMGESKYKILKKINQQYIPETIFYPAVPPLEAVLADISSHHINFPFVVKPDVGQGGWLITMICDETDLRSFLQKIRMPFMIQEYVDLPLELGVLYYRFPGETKGRISSLAIKELFAVTGDGSSTIRQLIEHHPRGHSQLQRLLKNKRIDLTRIPHKDEHVPLSFIGNHSFGTKFLSGNHLIDEKLNTLFDTLCADITGFYFGRFDIRSADMDAFRKGEFKILELNGVGSEPLHIFDPNEKLLRAYDSAFEHWRVIYKISLMNKKTISPYMKLEEAWNAYRNVARIQRIHQTNFTIGN